MQHALMEEILATELNSLNFISTGFLQVQDACPHRSPKTFTPKKKRRGKNAETQMGYV